MKIFPSTSMTARSFLIIGSSGSGKSTLLRCMNQLETITSGTITIDGKTLVETKNGAPSTQAKIFERNFNGNRIYFRT